MRSVYITLLSVLAVTLLATVGWRKRNSISQIFKLGGPVDRIKQRARSTWGRVENAAKVSASNLVHTEHDPEPICGS